MGITIPGVSSTLQRPVVAFSISSIITARQSGKDFRAIGLCEKTSEGSAEYKKIYTVTSEEMAISLFGKNSAGHCFYINYNNNHSVALAMMAVEEGTGTKANTKVTIKNDCTQSGMLTFRILGEEINLYINEGEAKEIAANLYNELVKVEGLPIVVKAIDSSSDDEVEIESAHTSISLKEIQFIVERNESDCEIEIVQTQGAGKEDLIDYLDAIGEEIYDFVAIPYSSSTILGNAKDWAEERDVALSSLDGHCIAISHVDFSDSTTYSNLTESKGISLFPMQSESPEIAMLAAIVAQIAASSANNQARPFQTLPLIGITPSAEVFTPIERSILLSNRMSTVQKNNERLVIERVLTLAPIGNPNSDLCDKLSITKFRRLLTRQLSTKYPRHIITSNENVDAPFTITLNTVKAEVVQFYTRAVSEAYMQDSGNFEKTLQIEKTGDRIILKLQIKTTDQLRQILGDISAQGN